MKLNGFILIIGLIYCSCQKPSKAPLEAEEQNTLESSKELAPQNVTQLNSCDLLDGTVFTYLPRPGKELHLFTLKFECDQDTLKGMIFGPSPQGEHGLAFYKTELKDLSIDDSSNVSFVVIPGALYEQQITLDNYQKEIQAFGVDRGEQIFKGKFLADTAITLNCSSEFYDCYTDDPIEFKLKE